MTSARPNRFLISAALLTLLFSLIILIASVYVRHENAVYVWDFSNYEHKCEDLLNRLDVSFEKAQLRFEESLLSDYNSLPCLPILWLYALLGKSRLGYILASALVYLSAYALTLGALSVSLFPKNRTLSFWLAAFLTLTIAPTWFSVLRGYPDVSSAVFINLAMLLYFKYFEIKNWRRALILGCFLGLAILFRRHFAYAVRAFLVTIMTSTAITFILSYRENSSRSFGRLVREGFFILLTVLFSLFIMWTIAPKFTEGIFHTNYRGLYRSYEYPPLTVLRQYTFVYGLGIGFFALFGMILSLRNQIQEKFRGIFISAFSIFLFLQWLFLGRQYGLHYTMHFHFIFVLGITAWILWLLERTKFWKIAGLTGTGFFLIFNFFVALTPQGRLPNPASYFFSQNEAPLVRHDYPELKRLVDYLRLGIRFKAPIYVVGASWTFNSKMIKEAEWKLYTEEESWLRITANPDMDSRDFYPLEGLLQADYVVLATPLPLHHPEDREQVVKIVYDTFIQNREFAQDFTRLPMEFSLDDNIKVWIYKRTQKTSMPVILRTLRQMQEHLTPKPAMQTDWMVLENKSQSEIAQRLWDPLFIGAWDFDAGSYLYFGSIPRNVLVTGKLTRHLKEGTGEKIYFKLTAMDSEGRIINETGQTLEASEKLVELKMDATSAVYLKMDIRCEKVCSFDLGHLTVKDSESTKSL